jgi:hypothetical protein
MHPKRFVQFVWVGNIAALRAFWQASSESGGQPGLRGKLPLASQGIFAHSPRAALNLKYIDENRRH